jgi:uncharacterized protein (TIGR02147 family)
MNEAQRPDVFSYLNFKDYLKDFVDFKKTLNKSISHRFIAQKVGSSPVGWLGDVLRAKRKLHGEALFRLVEWMELSASEEEHFDLLLRFEQASKMNEKDKIYRRVLQKAKLPQEVLTKESFLYFSDWFYAAVREYIVAKGFAGDYVKLQSSILPKLPMETLKEAIELLEKLGLIVKKANGDWQAKHVHIKKDLTTSALTFRNYFRSNAMVAMDAIENFPASERDFSTLTLAFSNQQLEEVRKELKAMRNRLKSISDQNSENKRVYQCLFQAYPLSK